MDSPRKPNKLKTILEFISGLLTLLKWVPFLGKWRTVIVALSTVVGVLTGLANRCDVQSKQPAQAEVTPTSTPTPPHTPSPSPTPTPVEIILNSVPQAGRAFTVRYTTAFQYNTHLWVDNYRLQVMGKELETGYLIANAVILNTAGKRTLTVRNAKGEILATKAIEVVHAEK